MSEENQVEAIKFGLTQYIGALLKETDRKGDEALHVTLAEFSEVWLECCKKEDGSYNYFVAKPILRAAEFLLRQRINEIKTASKDMTVETQKIIKNYDFAANVINNLIKSY